MEVITVTDEEASYHGRRLGREKVSYQGISTGAALYATIRVTQRQEQCDCNDLF